MITCNSGGNICIASAIAGIELTVWQTPYDKQPVVVIKNATMTLNQWSAIIDEMTKMLEQLKLEQEKRDD